MAGKARARLRLIAVDGVRGRAIARRAQDVRRKMKRKWNVHAGISRWDASGAFSELRAAGRKALTLTPRTLLLLYAADLAFRLRWEIRPALDAGHTVIVAPYVDTAIAFAEAEGLSRKWATELLRFAPRAGTRVRAGGAKKGKVPKSAAMLGFIEFATVAVRTLQRRTPAKPATAR